MTTLTQEQRKWLDKCAKDRWTLNPKTGLVDVFGDFHCSFQKGLKGFKGVKFGRASNNFYCNYNSLTSLMGAPQSVGGGFYCGDNHLTTLEGAPQSVGGNFYCHNNRLVSLEGAPQSVGGRFFFVYNPVSKETLEKMFDKMKKGDSFVIAAASLRNEMSEKDWKLIAKHIPEAIRPGVSMLARFGVFK